MKKFWPALLDIAALLVFVAVGRSVHGHVDSLSGFLSTAAPFFVGLVVGWVVSRAWSNPTNFIPNSLIIWISIVVVGQLLRLLVGQGSAVPFVLVSLGYFLLTVVGWRALYSLMVARLSSRSVGA